MLRGASRAMRDGSCELRNCISDELRWHDVLQGWFNGWITPMETMELEIQNTKVFVCFHWVLKRFLQRHRPHTTWLIQDSA